MKTSTGECIIQTDVENGIKYLSIEIVSKNTDLLYLKPGDTLRVIDLGVKGHYFDPNNTDIHMRLVPDTSKVLP